MLTKRAANQSLQRSPGLPSFGTTHRVSRHRGLQGRPAWCQGGIRQPVSRLAAMNLTCIPANEVAFGFRWTRRTSLLELTTTRLAEDLRADESLPLEALVTILRENEIKRSKDLVANIVHCKTGTGRFLNTVHFTMPLTHYAQKTPAYRRTMRSNKKLQRPKNSSSSSSRSSQSNI